MKYVNLNNTSVSTFVNKKGISELSGSSKYLVFDNEIFYKNTTPKNKIENTTALQDFLEFNVQNNTENEQIYSVIKTYLRLWFKRLQKIKLSSQENEDLIKYSEILLFLLKNGPEALLKRKLTENNLAQHKSRYQNIVRSKKTNYRLNKSKVRGKMYALFNLKCSEKFIAFYSISFPEGSPDDQLFKCFNYFLTALRKRFNLTNYIWISERQKNGTLHFHMLTNNYMPILSVNRTMAIIIDNQVKNLNMEWKNSSLEKYNGVDCDAIYNSKRHRKSGKKVNPTQIREWVSKYVTKYVTKNNEVFTHLCWHCSHSVSVLFTAQNFEFDKAHEIITQLPFPEYIYNMSLVDKNEFYIKIISEFCQSLIFKFVPPPKLFDNIILANNLIFSEFEPQPQKRTLKIKLNTKIL